MSKGRGNSEFRRKQVAMRRVEEIQRGQRGEDTLWEEVQSQSRHERRRYAKAARKFNKIHGEGEADRQLREAIEAEGGDHFAEAFLQGRAVRRGDREGSR